MFESVLKVIRGIVKLRGSTDGTLIGNVSDSIKVNVTNSFASGTADKSSFVYGTGIENSVGGVYQDTSPTLTAGQQGVVRLTTNRAFHVNVRDASGNEKLGSSTSALSIPVVVASDQGAIPASQSGTWNLNNITGTVSLPTGASTAALQTSGNASLTTIASNTGSLVLAQGSTTLGQTGSLTFGAVTTAAPSYTTGQTSALSLTVAGALRVDNSGVTQPISAASLPLPSGASTSALQTTISGQLPTALGAKTTANSLSVNIASDQVVPISATSLPLPTGAATAANQSTEITSLQLIDNVIGPVGAGTAGTNSALTGGVYNSTLPILTTGQQAATQLDSSGRLILGTGTATIGAVTQASGPWAQNITQFGSSAVVTGTGTSGAGIPRVTVSNDSTLSVTKVPLTPASPATNSVGVTSAAAVASNASRKGLTIINVSAAKVSLGLGNTAVLNSGITLYPGGVWVMDEYTFTTVAVNAIASIAASSISIQEFN